MLSVIYKVRLMVRKDPVSLGLLKTRFSLLALTRLVIRNLGLWHLRLLMVANPKVGIGVAPLFGALFAFSLLVPL